MKPIDSLEAKIEARAKKMMEGRKEGKGIEFILEAIKVKESPKKKKEFKQGLIKEIKKIVEDLKFDVNESVEEETEVKEDKVSEKPKKKAYNKVMRGMMGLGKGNGSKEDSLAEIDATSNFGKEESVKESLRESKQSIPEVKERLGENNSFSLIRLQSREGG